jgi:cation diffusion facilitator family transporter
MRTMQDRDKTAIHTIIWSILLNIVLAIIKGTTGILGNSYALIADAIESMNDVFASFLVFLGLKYASRPADENHPYGHGKIEPLVTFLVVSLLVGSAIFIAYQSIQHIRIPHESPEFFTIYILIGIIVFKELSFRYVYKKGKNLESTSLMADAWHHRSDALTSVVALIGILIAITFGEGYESADDWAALAASGLIMFNAYKIFRPALSEVMDEHVYDELIEKIRLAAKEVPGVLETEKCYVRKTGMYYWVDLHAVVSGVITVAEGHRISHQLKDYLLSKFPEIRNVLIHIEPDTDA